MLIESRRRMLMCKYKRLYINTFGTPPGPNAIREIEMQMNWLLSGAEYKWVECGNHIKYRLLLKVN